jgi:hypothetical protein
MKYITAIISIALTSALLLFELFTNNTYYIIQHAIQGCLITTLFLLFCNYGLEIINWIVLGAIPIFLFLGWIITPPPNYDHGDDECDVCCSPLKSCGCPIDTPSKPKNPVKPIKPIKPVECPARPFNI